jgi:MscS family membrane protein
MVIFADRPFELGDEITADGQTGVVESVGFRSTRFRTNEGHLVTIPNGQLANLTIVNISRRRNLVRKFTLQLAPGQPAEKVQQALAAVNEILANHEGLDPAQPPRVHFTELTAANLTLSVQYWYHPADRWKFLAFSERVNLEILRRFRAAGIALAGAPPPPPPTA